MRHVAIDLGSRESQICVRDEKGTVVEESRIATKSLPRYLKRHKSQSRVIVETSAEAFFVADAAKEAGHEVRVVPAHLVRALGVGERGIKTDQKDARKLSEVSARIDLPSVHVPTLLARERRALCQSRRVLLDARTKMTNHVRGTLRKEAIVWAGRSPSRFTAFVREKLLERPEGVPEYLERVLLCIEALNEQIALAEKELETMAKEDPIVSRLMTVPGVGPVIAVRFASAIDDPGRFANTHGVMSYLGLTPGENSSSLRKQRTGITKAGAEDLRFALVQGAWSAMRVRKGDPMVQWALRIAERRGKWIAVVALARKMSGILFALWRDQTTYDPTRGAKNLEDP